MAEKGIWAFHRCPKCGKTLKLIEESAGGFQYICKNCGDKK